MKVWVVFSSTPTASARDEGLFEGVFSSRSNALAYVAQSPDWFRIKQVLVDKKIATSSLLSPARRARGAKAKG